MKNHKSSDNLKEIFKPKAHHRPILTKTSTDRYRKNKIKKFFLNSNFSRKSLTSRKSDNDSKFSKLDNLLSSSQYFSLNKTKENKKSQKKNLNNDEKFRFTSFENMKVGYLTPLYSNTKFEKEAVINKNFYSGKKKKFASQTKISKEEEKNKKKFSCQVNKTTNNIELKTGKEEQKKRSMDIKFSRKKTTGFKTTKSSLGTFQKKTLKKRSQSKNTGVILPIDFDINERLDNVDTKNREIFHILNNIGKFDSNMGLDKNFQEISKSCKNFSRELRNFTKLGSYLDVGMIVSCYHGIVSSIGGILEKIDETIFRKKKIHHSERDHNHHHQKKSHEVKSSLFKKKFEYDQKIFQQKMLNLNVISERVSSVKESKMKIVNKNLKKELIQLEDLRTENYGNRISIKQKDKLIEKLRLEIAQLNLSSESYKFRIKIFVDTLEEKFKEQFDKNTELKKSLEYYLDEENSIANRMNRITEKFQR